MIAVDGLSSHDKEGGVVRDLLKSLAKKTAYAVAAFIIIAAVFVCAIRFLTPILDEHRADFEKLASQLLQSPVSINNVRVSWFQYQPVIGLNDVTILDKSSKEPILQIKKINIFFSIPQSVWQRKLVPSGIMISGADLNVNESATGELTLQGFPSLSFNQQPYRSETKFIDVMAWLSQQPRLILSNIDLRYTGFNGQKRYVTLYDLKFSNSRMEHTVLGKAILHQELPTEITLALQWSGQDIDLAKVKARVYLYVSGLSLSQWAKGFSVKGWQVNQGVVSVKIWATWDNGTFQKIQGAFQSYGLALYSQTDKSLHNINRLSGNVGWRRQGKGQIIAGDDILVDLPTHLWPVTRFYVSLMPDANGMLSLTTADVGYADLSDVQALMFSSPPLLPDSMQHMLSGLQVKGNLQNTAIVFSRPWNDWKHIAFNANFNQLSFSPWHAYPGISNLSGMLKWNGTQGELKFNTTRSIFQYSKAFTNEIDIDQLSGDVQIQRDQYNNWLLRASSIQLLNNDVAANVNGMLKFPWNGVPTADISANFTMQKAAHISRYLPLYHFDKNLAQWLQQAFLSGEVKSGNAILRGALTDFPFDDGNGLFSITGTVKNIDFRYAPNWPLLQKVSGLIVFKGRKITIDVDHAQTFGIPVTGIHGVIPYIGDAKPQILQVQIGEIQTDFAQGLRYVHASPLESNIGKMFSHVDMHGPMTLQLGLSVPLKNPDKTEVRGMLTISDSEMSLAPWKLMLNHLNGQVNFTEMSTTAKNIRAELFNKPLQFDLLTKQKTKNVSIVQASFANKFSIADLENWLKFPFSPVIRGTAYVTGAIDFSLIAPIEVHLRSDLVGVSVNLIDQYGKKAADARDFSADISMQESQPLRMKLSYDNLLNAAVILERKQEKYNLIGANLHFGSGQAAWPSSSGIYLTGQFDHLDYEKIKTVMNQSPNASFSSSMLKGIDMRVNDFNMAGQHFTAVHVLATRAKNNWDVNLASSEMVGQLKVPANLNRQALITAQFQKILMRSTPHSNQLGTLINVKSMPSIALVAQEVRYNDMQLGKIAFKAVPSTNGLYIQTLNIVSPRINLRATGDWVASGNNDVTRLHGVATSLHVSDLLNSVDLDATNFVSSNGTLNFNLSWGGAPYAPSLASMNGRASLALGQGRIVDIGENGAKMDFGRMLSIFSLQTIPRRLALDFSDVFQKGYSFDLVKGDFTIQDGDIYTKNLHFDGPVARVSIDGRIGLKNKDYNLILGVTAYVTSSIPLAATLLTGNPLIGLGALAVNTVIGSQVSNATTNYYAVTGPWNNPSWKSVRSSSPSNPAKR